MYIPVALGPGVGRKERMNERKSSQLNFFNNTKSEQEKTGGVN
jgi:hypothetical protein